MRIALILAQAQQGDLMRLWEMVSPALADDEEMELWLCSGNFDEASALKLPPGVAREIRQPGSALQLPETQLLWLCQMAEMRKPDLYIFYDNIAGHGLAVRLAARLGLPFFTDIHALQRQGTGLVATRKACGSYLDWKSTFADGRAVLSVARGRPKNANIPMQTPFLGGIPLQGETPANWILQQKALERRSENPLESAQRLFVGGRGLGSREGCDALRAVAAKHGAVAGFTRPVALNGWCGLHEIVGQSGIRSSPELCVAFGVSGAAAFLVGIQAAQKLVAVNTDIDAPIFRHADEGIVADALALLGTMQ